MGKYILEMCDIRKVFGEIVANDCINLRVENGEIHAIVGENGAGKSTLMKILNGLYTQDSGDIYIDGKLTEINSPSRASELGIGMVYQHFMLVPTLTVAENMILGVETKSAGLLDLKAARRKVKQVSEKYNLDIEPNAKVNDLSVGLRQRVEILKILFKGTSLFVFDEPTAVLAPQEIGQFYNIMRSLIANGNTVIFITHKLQEVLDVADNITVIRAGADVSHMTNKDVTKEKLASAMVGRKVLFNLDKKDTETGVNVLKIDSLKSKDDKGLPAVNGVSLEIKEGEILGIAGVQGNGQTELVEAMMGLRQVDEGSIHIKNKDITNKKTKQIINLGSSHIPEDRHKRGAVSQYSVAENLAFGVHKEKYSKWLNLDFKKLDKDSGELIEKYDIRPRNPSTPFGSLSGGNQQKVVVARELERDYKVLIASQLTRGVDVGAIESIHGMILNERDKGKAILLISSELSEILSLSDRIAVMYEGEIVGVLDTKDATEEKLGILMSGGKL